MSEVNQAVFLSYASQDAAAAARLCEALRAAGIEVWFDQNELVGGDAWDAKIRRQIAECALFVPIISANTQARLEGYFRIEWKLAAQRTHAMAEEKAFLLPVVIDDTRDAEAKVPGEFKAVQWTRIGSADSLAAFCVRIQRLLGGADAVGAALRRDDLSESRREAATTVRPAPSRRWLIPALGALGAVIVLAIWQPWKKAGPAAAADRSGAALTEAQKLVRQARALLDDDPMQLRENYFLADELAQRAAKLDPTDGEVWAIAGRASALLLRRRFDASQARKDLARMQVERAMSLAPASNESAFAQALQQEVAGRLTDSQRILEELTKRAPGDWRFFDALGELSLKADAFYDARGEIGPKRNPVEVALEFFRKAQALSGDDSRPGSGELRALLRLGRMAEARSKLERMMAGKPGRGAYLTGLLFNSMYYYDVPGTKAFIEKIPPRVLQEDAVISTLAEFYLRTGEGDRALEELKRMPRDFFEDGWDWRPKGYLAGYAHQVAGRPTAAQAEWKQALAVVEKRLAAEPNETLLLHWKSLLQALTGQAAEARAGRQLLRELEKAPNSWFDSILQVAIGNREEAIQSLVNEWGKASFALRNDLWGDWLYAPWYAPIRDDPRIRAMAYEHKAAIEQALNSANPTAKADRPAPTDKSIAVLPFVQLSPDGDNTGFADGIHLDVILALSKIRDLKVISRASVLAYRDPAQRHLRKIADDLGVAAVLEGTVRRSGNTLRVTAELLDPRTDRHLWSETYDKELKDVFAIQTELAVGIAKGLKATLLPQEKSLLERRPTANLRAYELYVAARERSTALSEESPSRASWEAVVRQLEQAVAEDPGFAAAYAQLALTHARIYTNPRLDQSPERKELARKAVAVAERLAPDAPETLLAAAYYAHACDYDYTRAGGLFAAAVERAPGDSEAIALFSLNHRRLGHFAEAVDTLAKAMALDPASAALRWPQYQHALFYLRRYADAAAGGERQVALLPSLAGNSSFVRYTAIARFEVDGDRDRLLEKLRGLPEDDANPERIVGRYIAALCSGDLAEAERVLSNPRIPPTAQFEIDTNPLNPIGMERALVAYLQGKTKLAAEHVVSVEAFIRQGNWTGNVHWNARSQLVRMAAFTGNKAEALRLAQELRRDIAGKDFQTERGELVRLGRTYALLGERDEALAILRTLMTGPSVTSFAGSPRLIRLDPCWSKLADDPRFDEILKAAKPL